jgi:CBS domain-containing protein
MAFFHDLVVAETGEKSETFHLEKSALRPLVDVGRALGLASDCVLEGSTLDRLALAREAFPASEAIFREAAEAFRVMLFHQNRAGLRHGHGGTEISPADLSHHDRQVLKSGFRAIARLLEYTAECNWLEPAS